MFLVFILEVDMTLLAELLAVLDRFCLISLKWLNVPGGCTCNACMLLADVLVVLACSLALRCAMGILRGGCLMLLPVFWARLHAWAPFRVWTVLAGFCLALRVGVCSR